MVVVKQDEYVGRWRDFAVQRESHQKMKRGAKMVWYKTSFGATFRVHGIDRVGICRLIFHWHVSGIIVRAGEMSEAPGHRVVESR